MQFFLYDIFSINKNYYGSNNTVNFLRQKFCFTNIYIPSSVVTHDKCSINVY